MSTIKKAGDSLMIRKVFPASISNLEAADAFLDEEMEKNDVSMKASIQLKVALEEIFVNVAHYAYPGGDGDVTLELEIKDGVLTLSFIDSGVPFDPLAKPDPDVTLSADERDIGGLGIFMVKKTMDDVTYRYENNQNILTLVKKI